MQDVSTVDSLDEGARSRLMHDLSLVLMYLPSWTERSDELPRFWKGFDFGVLNQLADEGLISDSRRSKSALLTEEGAVRARELLAVYVGTGAVQADSGPS